MVRVLVVDDNAVARMGVTAALAGLCAPADVVSASSGPEAVAVAAHDPVDVVLLDVRMAGGDGIDSVGLLAGGAAVIMGTRSNDPHLIQRALAAGARGYLLHEVITIELLQSAITTVLAGGLVVARGRPDCPVHQLPLPGPESYFDLTTTEVSVMRDLANGMSTKELASKRFLSEKTIRNHLSRIYAKLGVGSRCEAVARWWNAAEPARPEPQRSWWQ